MFHLFKCSNLFFLSWIPNLATGGLMACREYCTGLHEGFTPWSTSPLGMGSPAPLVSVSERTCFSRGNPCYWKRNCHSQLLSKPRRYHVEDFSQHEDHSCHPYHTNVFCIGSGQQLHGKLRDCAGEEEKRGLQGREGRRQTRLLRFAYYWKYY